MNEAIQFIIQGLFISIGTAIGSYFANKAILHNLEKVVSKINGKKQEGQSEAERNGKD